MKQTLRYIGNFIELGYDHHPDPPSLVAGRGKLDPAIKPQVLAYLRAGNMLIFSPGVDDDVLDPARRSDSPSIRMDGTYCWPQTLAYYVDRYDVELPAEFIAHARANDWQVPVVDPLSVQTPRYPG